jgi:acyl-CoA synthetase (AMP-forming)/AMP-acid ligase II
MNLASILEEQASRSGDRLAIIEARQRITFSELDRAAASAAGDLARAGVRAGMRVLVLVPMSIALYTTMIALFRMRATVVFVDPSAGRARLDRSVASVRPDAFVAIPRAHWLRLTSSAIRAIPIKAALGGNVFGAARIARRLSAHVERIEPCDPDTPAIITFTSGSTGDPKPAVRTHGFLIAQHGVLADDLALAAGDVDLCTLPIVLLANLASGVTSVIPDADLRAPGAIDPSPVDAQIRAVHATRIVASPALVERLVQHASGRGARLDTFRRIYMGGAPVFPQMMDSAARVAPHASIVAVYGSTEAEPIASIDRREIGEHDRVAMAGGAGILAGRPSAAIELRILPDRWGTPVGPWTPADLERETLVANQIGEIVVAGEHVLPGYLDGVGNQETKITVDGRVWHRTGDAGCLDESGRLWLLGRCSAKASDATGVLYPFAVECAAGEVADVARTAFVTHRQQRVLAVQLKREAASARTELLTRLAWARLDDIVVVDRIPVDPRHNAKVNYPSLMQLLDRLRREGS